MISAWHLLWIIPLSAYAGMFIMSLCVMARRDDSDHYDTDFMRYSRTVKRGSR